MMALAGAGTGASLLGGSSAPTINVPAAEAPTPATSAAAARKGGAIVRVGGDERKSTATDTPEYTPFEEKRVSGKALGGLGRGGLGL